MLYSIYSTLTSVNQIYLLFTLIYISVLAVANLSPQLPIDCPWFNDIKICAVPEYRDGIHERVGELL